MIWVPAFAGMSGFGGSEYRAFGDIKSLDWEQSMRKLAALFSLLLPFFGVSGIANGAVAPIGSLYPGAHLEPLTKETDSCGRRYRFSVGATEEQVARFYIAEGTAAGLVVSADNATPGFRIIIMGEKGPGRVLSVIINSDKQPLIADIYYVLNRVPGCS